MEQLHFVYLPQYQVLLCHENGGCVSKKRFKRHIWELHAAHGEIAQTASREVQALDIAEPKTVALPDPDSPPIPGLKVWSFIRCLLSLMSNCTQGWVQLLLVLNFYRGAGIY